MTPDAPRQDSSPDLATYVDEFGEQFFAATAAERRDSATPVPGPLARGPRRRWLTGGGLAAAAVLAILAFLLLPNGRVDIVKEASAALGTRGEIVHYRSAGCGGSFQGHRDEVEADCGHRGDVTEVWQTTSGRPRWRMSTPVIRDDGDRYMTGDGQRILGPQIFGLDGDTSIAYWPQINRLDITTDLPADYPKYPNVLGGTGDEADVIKTLRSKLTNGALSVARHTRERGRDVILLTGHTRTTTHGGGPPSGTINESTLRYLVDAKTFAPVRLTTHATTQFFKGNGRPKDGKFTSSFTTVFPLFERLPLNTKTQRLLEVIPERPPTKIAKRTAAQAEAEEMARMRRTNAEGHANALRTQAQHRAKAGTGK